MREWESMVLCKSIISNLSRWTFATSEKQITNANWITVDYIDYFYLCTHLCHVHSNTEMNGQITMTIKEHKKEERTIGAPKRVQGDWSTTGKWNGKHEHKQMQGLAIQHGQAQFHNELLLLDFGRVMLILRLKFNPRQSGPVMSENIT